MQTVILASSNSGKINEYSMLLSGIFNIVPQREYGLTTPAETGLSFIENALIKARHISKQSKMPAIADDSGLAVDVLGGAPGIYSARYAGKNSSDQQNITKLLNQMHGIAQHERHAQFHCAIAYLRHPDDPLPIVAQGSWSGVILPQMQGTGGFGYDPVFYLPDKQCTAAEPNPAEKNRLSHRAQALRMFLQAYQC